MSLFISVERLLFNLEDVFVRAHTALRGPIRNTTTHETALDLAQLENRVLMSAAPVGAEVLVEEAANPDAAVVETGVASSDSNNLPVAQSQTIEVNLKDRMVGKYSIAHSSTDYSNRLVGWSLTETGWGPFIENQVMPAIEAGFTRFDLHNPFGRAADDRLMAFDQYLDAMVDTPKLTENFAELWRPITDSGIEVIGYIGTPNNDPIQRALLDDPDAWWDRALAAVQPLVDAGMSIGLDATANLGADTMDYELAEYLRDQGVRVYVEARPGAGNDHWFDYPIMLQTNTWDRQAPELHENHIDRHAWDYELTGEVLRLFRANELGESGNWENLKSVLEIGHSAAVNPTFVYREDHANTTLDELLAGFDIPSVPTEIGLKASDADGDNLTYTIVTGPSHGTLTVNPDNPALFVYTPDAYYSGTDSFEFKVNDGTDDSQVATITINVQDTSATAPPNSDVAPPQPIATPPDTNAIPQQRDKTFAGLARDRLPPGLVEAIRSDATIHAGRLGVLERSGRHDHGLFAETGIARQKPTDFLSSKRLEQPQQNDPIQEPVVDLHSTVRANQQEDLSTQDRGIESSRSEAQGSARRDSSRTPVAKPVDSAVRVNGEDVTATSETTVEEAQDATSEKIEEVTDQQPEVTDAPTDEVAGVNKATTESTGEHVEQRA